MEEAPPHLVRKQSPQSFAQSLADSLLLCGSIAHSGFSNTSGTIQIVCPFQKSSYQLISDSLHILEFCLSQELPRSY